MNSTTATKELLSVYQLAIKNIIMTTYAGKEK